jgi:acyl CoA:acetate/3-ketoacid CoA transferase alpha subunit
MDDETTYMIVRHRFHGDREVIERGLTLDEAQAHCQRDDTHGDGWFDGYTEDDDQ